MNPCPENLIFLDFLSCAVAIAKSYLTIRNNSVISIKTEGTEKSVALERYSFDVCVAQLRNGQLGQVLQM